MAAEQRWENDPHESDTFVSILAQRQQVQARRARELAELFADREELRGVHALADLVGEQVTWCA